MFLDQRRTNGKVNIRALIIEIKAVFISDLQIRNETIKAAIPIPTFNP